MIACSMTAIRADWGDIRTGRLVALVGISTDWLFEVGKGFVIVPPSNSRFIDEPLVSAWSCDREVVMLRWPIRLKLMVGLSLVVGMMLILMGGSIFGLHSFHMSNLTQGDQLREIKASTELFAAVFRLHARGEKSSEAEIKELLPRVVEAREALQVYFLQLKKNSSQGTRADSGIGELELALLMDFDLTAILNELDPGQGRVEPLFPGTTIYVPDLLPKFKPATDVKSRIERLYDTVSQLPKKLYQDFWNVLQMSQGQYHTSRIIVWSSAFMVMVMLCGLTTLFQRWVLFPVRMLQRGVRHVAWGSFDYKINLKSGDEMQDLAEAFNDMTAKISVTYADLESQVQERSRQLVRSERLAGVGFLAAGVAHEINNPLASIAFCAEALDHRLERARLIPGRIPTCRLVVQLPEDDPGRGVPV